MNWIKVTPETMPEISDSGMFSKELWLTVVDESTGSKRVVKSHYAMLILKRDPIKEISGYSESDKTGVFLPEYKFKKYYPGSDFGEIVRDENIKVTHWAYVECPEPAED